MLLDRIDTDYAELTGLGAWEHSNMPAKLISNGIIACLFLIALFAPHSVAVTQTAWLIGMALWVARFAFYPRPTLHRSPMDYALLGFFILSGISAVFSYNPVMSIGKMRAASLFTIVYLVSQNIQSLRLVRLLALTLIASCMVNVFLTAGQFAIGKGVKVQGVRPESPLSKAVFRTRSVVQPTSIIDGDTIWKVDGRDVGSPEEIAAALASGPTTARVRIYRVEWMPEFELPRGQLLPGTDCFAAVGHQWLVARARLACDRFFQPLGDVFGSVATDRIAGIGNPSRAQTEEELDRIIASSRGDWVRVCAGNDRDARFVDWLCCISGGDVDADRVASNGADRCCVCDTDRSCERLLASAETKHRIFRPARSIDQLARNGLERRF